MPRLSKIGAAALAAFGWTTGSSGVTANYLVVAGGGGGGSGYAAIGGGGGGAGGYRTGSLSLNSTLSYTVTVGAGGTGASSTVEAKGTNGSNSVFSSITSTGGGAGGVGSTTQSIRDGASGGSGGGGATDTSTGTATGTGGAGTSGQGNNGGTSTGGSSSFPGAGGGGAGAVGANNPSGSTAGNGGAGLSSSISSVSVDYAGGGGGGSKSGTAGTASHGGGAGSNSGSAGSSGTANTGGGGGGGGAGASGTPRGDGGAGGSGIVIISYAGAQQFGGGVVTSVGGNTIHTFTTSGTLVPVTPLSASYLVVAGGGGGGRSTVGNGGGGAGGLLSGSSLTIDTNSIYLVTVGAGGNGATGTANGSNGTNSTFSLVSTTAIGGGGGDGAGSGANAGGSGGGGRNDGAAGGAGTSGQGFAGGNGSTGAPYPGAGGGGASAAGQNSQASTGGVGGAGTASSISGASVTYAGGGGGGCYTGGTGAAGGAGGNPGVAGTSGTANLGGGGGGGGSSANGGNGGSGVVIISYAGSTQQMAGGTVTITGGNVIHTFTSSGYLTPIKYVSNSLRFRASATAYLSRTNTSSPTNAKIGTLSMWLKRGSLATGNSQYLMMTGTGTSNNTNFTLFFDTSNNINAGQYSETPFTNTSVVFRDPAAWYHLVITYDSTQATASNRFKLYINNQLFTSSTTITQNNEWAILQASQLLNIGRHDGVGRYFDGYMTEVNLIDGQALTPNSFGTFNSYGVWQPITYGGSYGKNGFYLPFTNKTSTTTLGYDFSPNGNNWTTNNISLTTGATYDSMTDVPTLTSATAANFATLNPIRPSSSGGFSNGNLTGTAETSTQRGLTSTIALPWNGKWYAEVTFASSIYNWCGVTAVDFLAADINTAGQMSVLYYASNGNKYVNGTASAYGASYTTETMGIAFDGPAGTITFYKANTSQGAITLPSSTVNYVFCQANAAGSAIAANWNFGQQPWTYTPPTGFVALNTYNL